jgi:hypothetical protein
MWTARNETTRRARRPFWRSRWWLPLFSLGLGVLILVACLVGGAPWTGVGGLAVMAAFGAMFLVGGRSETLRGLAGPGRDERWAMIDMRATAFAGTATVLALTVFWLVDLARGGDGSPYGQMMAIGGVSYIAAVAWLRYRG